MFYLNLFNTGQCLPGTFSLDGLEPCETCSIGFYQPGYAFINCIPCPNGTTTWRRGSRRVTECGRKKNIYCQSNNWSLCEIYYLV